MPSDINPVPAPRQAVATPAAGSGTAAAAPRSTSVLASSPAVQEAMRLDRAQSTAARVGRIDASWAAANPDAAAAALTRAEWQQYQQDFVPVEGELLARANSTGWIRDEANQASAITRAALARQPGALQDTFRRQGVAPTEAQTAAIERRRNLAVATESATAENLSRRAGRDQRTNLMADSLSTGRSLASSASTALTSAAGLQTARKQAGAAAGASRKASAIGGMASGAAIGSMFGLGWGTVIGGGIGLLAGLL